MFEKHLSGFHTVSQPTGTTAHCRRGASALAALAALLAASGPLVAADPQLVINELMYNPIEYWPANQPHPNTNLTEYVEVYNAGATPLDLANYRFDTGIVFNFTNGLLAPGAYAVICQNYPFFTNAYKTVTNVVGQYDGSLSNGGEPLQLSRFDGTNWVTEDAFTYFDDGDSDGTGRSLELVNPKFARLDNQYSWDWLASSVVSGTPGVVNSRFTAAPAPVGGDVTQDRSLPPGNSAVKITAHATGRDGFTTNTLTSVLLEYRRDALSPPAYTNARMRDDGIEGDTTANDGIYTAFLPPAGSGLVTTNGDIFEYRIKLTDALGTRTLPATNRTGIVGTTYSYLVKFDIDTFADAAYPGEYETFHILMTAANKNLLQTRPVTSDDLIDATIVVGNQVFYNGSVRLRGGTSRNALLGNYRVEIPPPHDLDGLTRINLNHVNALRQHIGMVITDRTTGGYAFDSSLARVYLNSERKNPSQGIYHRFETFGNSMMDRIYGTTATVNMYSADGDFRTGYLQYVDENLTSYQNLYYGDAENPFTAWKDMLNLSRAINMTPAQMVTNLPNYMNVEGFGALFGTQIAIGNREAGFLTPTENCYGDELRVVADTATGKFDVYPWDYDDVIYSGTPLWAYNSGTASATVRKFLFNHPVVPYFVGHARDAIVSVMSAENMTALFNEMGSKMNSFEAAYLSTIASQRTSVLAEIATNLTVSGLPAGGTTLLRPSTNSGASITASPINQNIGAGQWVLLGSVPLTLPGASVKLTRQSAQPAVFSIADAIMFSNALAGATIIEDGGAGFSTSGAWSVAGSGGYGGGAYHYASNESGKLANWTANLAQPGTYNVYAWCFTSTNGNSETATRYDVTAGQNGVVLNTLSGTAPQAYVAQVTVNNVPTSWDLRNNLWSITNPIVLAGDVADVTVRAVHPNGSILKSLNFKAVAQRTPVLAPASIVGSVVWTNAAGIYVVSNDVTVAAGSSLTIAPSTTVLFASGRRLIVNGTLNLLGTPDTPAFGLPYAGNSPWSIEANGASASVVISNAVLSFGRVVASNNAALAIYDSRLSDSADPAGIVAATNAGGVYIGGCIVSNFNSMAFASSPARVDRSLLTHMTGVGIAFSGAATTATVSRTTVRDPLGTDGISFSGSTAGLVTNTLLVGMTGTGVVINAATVRVVNSLLVDNVTGIRVAGASAATVLNTTIDGGTNSLHGTAAVTNAIFRDALVSITNGPATVAHSNVELPGYDVFAGTANLNRKAFFRDSDSLDYQLLPTSPCIGTGTAGQNMGMTHPSGANPIAPANLALLATSNTILLAWSDLSPDETGFEIERSNNGDPGTFTRIATTAAGVTNHTDTGLGVDNSYYYRVRAIHARGASTWTDVTSIRTTFAQMTDLLIANLRLTEIMYNPPGSSDLEEFLEFKNISTNAILDLSGLFFDAGLTFAFTNGTTLGPQQFFLLVRNSAAYLAAHPGAPVHGIFAAGALNNGGEQLLIHDLAGNPILDVDYNNSWYATTDGLGYTLVPNDPNPADGNPNLAASWRASANAGGSPGANDPEPLGSGIVINEVLAHTDPPLVDAIEVRNIGTNAVNLSNWYLSDSLTNLKKFQIPVVPALPPGGYAAIYANTFSNAFLISELGDEPVVLSATTGGTNLTGYRSTFTFNGAVDNGIAHGRHVRSDGVVENTALSAITLGTNNAAPLIGPVVINEIMYNPGPGGKEYVELRNVAAGNTRLWNTNFAPTNAWNTWTFSGAFDFTFPLNTTITQGEHVLLTDIDPAEFRAAMGIPASIRIFGPFSGDLANNGETIRMLKPGDPELDGFVPRIVVDRVAFDDAYPWPTAADGNGPSLEKLSPTLYGGDPTNWVAVTPGGTPGTSNNTVVIPTVGFADASDSSVETNETINVKVSLTPSVTSTVTVYYAVTGGTAFQGGDFSLTPGVVIFYPHETEKTIPLAILNDSTPAGEANETIEITLTNLAGNASFGGNRVYTHTIVDNDATTLTPPFILPATTTDFTNSVLITMAPSVAGSTIRYTLTGTLPDHNDTAYTGPFLLTRSAQIAARTFLGDINAGATTTVLFRAQAIPQGWIPPSSIPPNAILAATFASSDDGWQASGPGAMNLTSTTIALATNGNFGALFRFNNVAIPQGANVTNAYIQFTAAADNAVSSFVSIRGEATNNASTLVLVNQNIRNRLVTTNRVVWTPPAWVSNLRSTDQRTPNLAPIINEIVGRPGWVVSNSLALIFTNTPSGARTIYAFDGSPDQAAALYAEWDPAPPAGFHYFAALTNGSGTISGGNLTVPEGSNASATASANTGHTFAGWSGDTGPADTNNPVLTVTMDQDRTVTANFAPILHFFTVLTNGAGTVSGGNLWVIEGAEATATADADYGAAFTGWSGDTGTGDPAALTLNLVMDQPRTVTANFVLLPPPPTSRVMTVSSPAPNQFTITWLGNSNYIYDVYRTTNLLLDVLGTTIATNLPGHPSGTNSYTDPAMPLPVGFYSIGSDFPQ